MARPDVALFRNFECEATEEDKISFTCTYPVMYEPKRNVSDVVYRPTSVDVRMVESDEILRRVQIQNCETCYGRQKTVLSVKKSSLITGLPISCTVEFEAQESLNGTRSLSIKAESNKIEMDLNCGLKDEISSCSSTLNIFGDNWLELILGNKKTATASISYCIFFGNSETFRTVKSPLQIEKTTDDQINVTTPIPRLLFNQQKRIREIRLTCPEDRSVYVSCEVYMFVPREYGTKAVPNRSRDLNTTESNTTIAARIETLVAEESAKLQSSPIEGNHWVMIVIALAIGVTFTIALTFLAYIYWIKRRSGSYKTLEDNVVNEFEEL